MSRLSGFAAADDVLDALQDWAEAHEVCAADVGTSATLDIPARGEPAASLDVRGRERPQRSRHFRERQFGELSGFKARYPLRKRLVQHRLSLVSHRRAGP